jgi:hypothetical protein
VELNHTHAMRVESGTVRAFVKCRGNNKKYVYNAIWSINVDDGRDDEGGCNQPVIGAFGHAR